MISLKEKRKLQNQSKKILNKMKSDLVYEYAYKNGSIGRYCKKRNEIKKLQKEQIRFMENI